MIVFNFFQVLNYLLNDNWMYIFLHILIPVRASRTIAMNLYNEKSSKCSSVEEQINPGIRFCFLE